MRAKFQGHLAIDVATANAFAQESLAPCARRFNELNKQSETIALDPKSYQVSGYPDVALTSNYVRDSRGQRFNGHLVEKNILACGAPTEDLPGSMAQFAAVLIEQDVGLVLDLRTRRQMVRADYRPEERQEFTFEGQTSTFQARGDGPPVRGYSNAAAMSGTVTVSAGERKRDISFLNFPIEDYGPASPDDLDVIATAINTFKKQHADQRIAVHCRAGVGRTGMAIIAAELRQMLADGKLTEVNRQGELDQAICRLRASRSDKMVQSLSQYSALESYTKELVGGRFTAAIARDQADSRATMPALPSLLTAAWLAARPEHATALDSAGQPPAQPAPSQRPTTPTLLPDQQFLRLDQELKILETTASQLKKDIKKAQPSLLARLGLRAPPAEGTGASPVLQRLKEQLEDTNKQRKAKFKELEDLRPQTSFAQQDVLSLFWQGERKPPPK